VPDDGCVAGAERILAIAKAAGDRDLVFTLFSDGASSLFTLPAPGLTLDDIRQVYFLAIKYGDQRLIHQVMPYISAVKSGRIMLHIHPARTINLVMQVGLYPRWHGRIPETGWWVPCWPPPRQRMAQAVDELKERLWWHEFTPGLRAALESADGRYEVPDLAKFAKMRFAYWQPIDCYQMVEGARARAEELGLKGVILSADLHTLSSAAASVLGHIAFECARYGRPFEPPVALITGGHLDVPISDATGIGGRNQEFTLLWAQTLQEGRLASRRIVVAAMDSDGTDGPGTQHMEHADEPICMAGGIVDGHTMEMAAEMGVDVVAELERHNSTVALMVLKSAIYTGNTGMALGDLRVAVVQ
jgi:glycerate-2-kinase